MAKGNQKTEESRGSANKIQGKKRNNNNATANDNSEDEREILVVPDSESDSQSDDEVAQVDDSNGEDDDDGEEEEVATQRSEIANQHTNGALESDHEKEVEEDGEREDVSKKKKRNHQKKRYDKDENGASYCFPTSRISRIIKSEDSGTRISEDAVFLINKASEKFLKLFCREAYACAFLDQKKQIEYKHLSSVVSKQKRFDFLSDFVPEKVRAQDALTEMSSGET